MIAIIDAFSISVFSIRFDYNGHSKNGYASWTGNADAPYGNAYYESNEDFMF
jgi:hypothetical protein